MKLFQIAFLALLCALPLRGQQAPPPTPQATPAEVFAALEAQVEKAYSAWVKDIRAKIEKAEADGTDLPRSAYTPPYKAFVPQFQAGAKANAGTDEAIPYLAWLIREGMQADPESGQQAFVTLVEGHAKSEAFARVASQLISLPQHFEEQEANRLLRKVEADSPIAKVRAWAVLGRLADTLEESPLESEAYKAAKKEMLSAMEGVKDSRLSSEVGQRIDVRERFSNGMPAPDITGIDLAGTAFKLSDYKGQVIFLDFWGDW